MEKKEHIENYILNQWIVIPCRHREKIPLMKEWQKKRSNTKEEIQLWNKEYENYNIGVLTGSPSEIVMIDVDGEEGKKYLDEISNGDLPKTATFKTPGNGIRYVYKIPKGIQLKTKSIPLEGDHQEVALMSDNKYSIMPPSIHPNGGKYEWLQGLAPWEIEIPEAPKWMIDKMTEKNNSAKSYSVKGGNINISQSNSGFMINKLSNLCPKFRAILVQQKKSGLDEEMWFKIINLFSTCGCSGSALLFSKQSNKHDKRSEYRINELISNTYAPIRCTDLGCEYSEIFKCQQYVDRKDNEISNSPAFWLNRFKMFNPPKKEVYKNVVKRLYPLKDYAIDENGCIYRVGTNPMLLSNFVVYPTEEIITTDGVNEDSKIKIVGVLEEGKVLNETTVTASEFSSLDWIVKNYGVKPYITTGRHNRKFMLELIQKLSTNIPNKKIYTHLGWIENDEQWSYLHAGGCIGSQDIEVNIDPQLSRYSLDNKLDPNDAIILSMKLFEVASYEITIPLISLVFLAPLVSIVDPNNTPKFIIWMHGLTGSRKTSLAMCLLNHFGNFGNTPLMSFRDTANSIEAKAHILKDTLLVLDDFSPALNGIEALKMNEIAERILRIYGDRVGRGRLNSNIELQKTFVPRGLALVTGEDIPKGTSSTARYIGIEVKKEDIDLEILTILQDNSESLSRTMYAYIEYISQNISEVREFTDIEFKKCRQKYSNNALHGRIADAISWLDVAFKIYLKFIYEHMNIYEYDRDELISECDRVLSKLLDEQNNAYKTQEIEEVFIEAFVEAINTGKIYVMDLKLQHNDDELQMSNSKGTFVGYEDDEFFYLYPDAFFSEVNKCLSSKGMKTSISAQTLWKTMKNKNLIKCEQNQLKPKKIVPLINGGKSRVRLIHLYKKYLNLGE